MRPTRPRAGDKWETNERQIGDKRGKSEGNHATNRTQTGRQMKDTWETTEGNHATNQTQSNPEWETSRKHMKNKCETSEGNDATN